jgi:excinuclease ABC subunit C
MDELLANTQFAAETFATFGPSPCAPRRAVTATIQVSDDAREVRRVLRAHCPCLPGVYGMLDAAGELVYVGMSVRLRHRLLTYFTKGRAEGKEQRIAGHAAHLVWEVGEHELTVQLRELELIRHWRPRFNARGRPGRQEIGYIYLAAGEAPNLRVGRRVPRGVHHCWGPLPLSHRVRAAVQQLNYHFHLRDCPDRTPMRYADQMTLLPHDCHPACLRGEIGTCLAPCSGERRQAEYGRCIAAARAMLDGQDTTILDHYATAMQSAAARQAFELAAVYRDSWEQLSVLHDQLRLLQAAQRDLWFVYPIRRISATNGRASGKWLLIAGGTIAAVVGEPRTSAAACRCGELLQRTFGDRRAAAPQDYDQIRLVASWFRQHPDERDRVLSPDQALAVCQ